MKITPLNRREQNTNAILASVHKQLKAQTWRGLYVAGWEEIKNTSSPSKTTTLKVAFFMSGVFATAFVVGSATFGTLALTQAIDDYKHEGEAPIVGHFSEWTMQSLFGAFYASRGPYEIAQLGYIPTIEHLFNEQIYRSDLSREQQVLIYEEKMHVLKKQQQNSLVATPHLPVVNKDIQCEAVDIISLDAELQEIYRSIEKELDISDYMLVKKGWEELKSSNNEKYITTLKIISAVSGTVLLGQFVIYGAGIYWSANQAIEDDQAGDNPSIGGHCLEWFAEMLGVGNGFFTLFSELSNMGAMIWKIEVFNKYIMKLQREEEYRKEVKIERLKQLLVDQLDNIPQGYFFSLPTDKKFEQIET